MKRKNRWAYLIAVLLITLTNSKTLVAQGPIKNMWKTALYVSSVYNIGNKTDTLTGTAFLIADGENVYMVTAKHLVGRTLSGMNQKLRNTKIYIGNSTNIDNIGVLLPDGSKVDEQSKPYILSGDDEDIAIISLQKTVYKKILDEIHVMGIIPTDITSFENSSDLPVGTEILHHAWFTYKNKVGQKIKMQGIMEHNTKLADNKTGFISIKGFYRQGFNGAPLFTRDNKLVGMIISGEGYLHNADIVANPYKTGNFITAVTSAQILQQLKKLQEIELKPAF